MEMCFQLERQLGRGSFGVVYCASAIHDSERKFAIKMQEKREIISKRAVLQVKREASIQVSKKMNHREFLSFQVEKRVKGSEILQEKNSENKKTFI